MLFTASTVTADKQIPHENWGSKSKAHHPMPHYPQLKSTGEKRVVNVGQFVSYQVNVNAQGDNILRDAANEPSIAVNPNNPNQIAIGWRQFNDTRSDFREAGVAYSTDGGMTWINNGPIEAGVFRSDPVLAADADGHFFYQSLSVSALGEFQVNQWRSHDGGKNWFDKTFAYGGDKSWYAIDDTQSSSRGNIYAAWNLAGNEYAPSSFNYSVDNGQSYTFPEELPNTPIFGTVAVGFDGEVYVVGLYQENNLAFNYLIKSQNPMAAMFPDFQQQTMLNLGGSIGIGGINPAGLLGQIWVAADKSNRHTRGNVYVAASVDPVGGDPLDFNFVRSRDGGDSFSDFLTINDDTGFGDWQWFGTMGVAPNGRIDLIWLDTRNAPNSFGGKLFSELFYSYSYDGGVSFSKNQAISPSFNHSQGYPVQQKMGDYIDIVSDNLGAHVAYTATFTGGQDVYYIHAKPAAVEENPYFPSHEMDGIWHNPDVPRQGVLSKTLVPNISGPQSAITQFEAVFTEDPDGNPTWFVLQQQQPKEADFIEFVIMYPTGDLSADGVAMRPIGLATKKRLYDDEGELKKYMLDYQFDMTDEVMETVMNMTEPASAFNADFYTNSPFYQTNKAIILTPVIAPEQSTAIHCNLQNLIFENPTETAEGRLPVAFESGSQGTLFVADFTYQKTVDEAGNQTLVTDASGLAIPTWQVMNAKSGDLLNHEPIISDVSKPNGGNGFFKVNPNDPGLTQLGTETLTRSAAFELTSENSNGSVEKFNYIAFNSFCGDVRPL